MARQPSRSMFPCPSSCHIPWDQISQGLHSMISWTLWTVTWNLKLNKPFLSKIAFAALFFLNLSYNIFYHILSPPLTHSDTPCTLLWFSLLRNIPNQQQSTKYHKIKTNHGSYFVLVKYFCAWGLPWRTFAISSFTPLKRTILLVPETLSFK